LWQPPHPYGPGHRHRLPVDGGHRVHRRPGQRVLAALYCSTWSAWQRAQVAGVGTAALAASSALVCSGAVAGLAADALALVLAGLPVGDDARGRLLVAADAGVGRGGAALPLGGGAFAAGAARRTDRASTWGIDTVSSVGGVGGYFEGVATAGTWDGSRSGRRPRRARRRAACSGAVGPSRGARGTGSSGSRGTRAWSASGGALQRAQDLHQRRQQGALLGFGQPADGGERVRRPVVRAPGGRLPLARELEVARPPVVPGGPLLEQPLRTSAATASLASARRPTAPWPRPRAARARRGGRPAARRCGPASASARARRCAPSCRCAARGRSSPGGEQAAREVGDVGAGEADEADEKEEEAAAAVAGVDFIRTPKYRGARRRQGGRGVLAPHPPRGRERRSAGGRMAGRGAALRKGRT
jgi:hypothetical protein